MKRFLFIFVTLLLMVETVKADGIIVSNVNLQPNGTTTVEVELNNTETSYRAVLIDVTLPAGLAVVYDEYGAAQVSKGERLSAKYSVTGNHLENGADRFGVINTTDDEVIAGESGILFSFTISADGGLIPGSVLTANVTGIKLTDAGATDHVQDNFTFNISIEEIRTILDETSTTAPEASDGAVDVRVKRTITAGNWNTICLPFAMTTAQLKDVFGNDVQLADFVDYDTEEDTEENTIGITVNFETAAAIEANHPYIIKVSEAVTEFTVDGVEISPEDDPCVEYDNGKTGKKREVYGRFVGTFVADFDFYNDAKNYPLFLNGNKFYYATENSKHMKAFRAYFDFVDYLAEAEGTEVKLCVDGFETRIEGLQMKDAAGTIFELSGRRVSKPAQRGIYIVNGKKTLIK